MEGIDIAKLAGQGGITLVIVGAFVWLVRQVGLALVASINNLDKRIDEHTKLDLAHHAQVKSAIDRLDGKIDGILDQADRFTPVQEIPREMSRPVRARSEPGGERR